MLLQNLTLLTNDTIVMVTNIAARAQEMPAPKAIAIKADALPVGASIVTPILPNRISASPQDSVQIIVSTGKPGSMGSSTVYTGEPTISGLEAARRAAHQAAQRAQIETAPLASTAAVAKAYAEAKALGPDSV